MKNINAEDFSKLLIELGACEEAKDWARGMDFATVWSTCERGNWMLWLLSQMIDKSEWLSHKQVILIACDCAEASLKYVKAGETRPADCIAITRRWVLGLATIEEVKEARNAAYAAYAAAAAAAYANVAYAAAAYAAYAAAAYANVAYAAAAYAAAAYAAYAAAAAAAAAYAAAAYAAAAYAAAAVARKDSLKNSADICRKYSTVEVVE